MSALHGRRVIFVFEELELGGAERQGLCLARHLRDSEGAHVEVWGFGRPGVLAARCETLDIPWRIVPAPWSRGRAGKLHSRGRVTGTLRRARPDGILPFTWRPNVLCGAVWRLTGARACIWNQRDVGLQRDGRVLERRAVTNVSAWVSNSEPGRDFLVRELGAPADRVRVVSNGVDPGCPAADRMSWRRRLGLDAHDFVAAMVANIHQFKDHGTLIRTWRHVVDGDAGRGRRAVLLLAGHAHNPLRLASLEALVRDLDLGDHVQFLGHVDDVAGLYEAADLGVLSSPSEGLPNAVLEAMAAGLAVAGTDNAGMRGAVGPAGYPFLAPAGDAQALAEHILHLAADAEGRARLGETNRRRAQSEFTSERMCAAMTAIIARALASGAGHP